MLSTHSRRTHFATVAALAAGITLVSTGASGFSSVLFALQGLDLSTYSVVAGGVMSGTARLAQTTSMVGAIVAIRSSNAAVAAVPTSMPVPPGGDRTTFPVRGLTAGCADITATQGGSSRTRYMVVHPSGTASFTLTVPENVLPYGGAPVPGRVSLGMPGLGTSSVSLTSSNTSVVTVPATRPLVRGSASFSITMVGEGCATISARIGSNIVRKTVRAIYIGG